MSHTERLAVDGRDGQNFGVTVPARMKEVCERDAEELGLSTAAAVRYWIQLGRRLGPVYDPRADGTDHAVTPFRAQVPEGAENAITLERDGRAVYRTDAD